MKLTMDSSQYGPDMARNVGDVVDVDKEEATRLLNSGLAHESTKGEIAVAEAKAEAAAEVEAKQKAAAADDLKKRKAAEAEAKKKAEAEAKGAADPRHENTERAVDETREKAVL